MKNENFNRNTLLGVYLNLATRSIDYSKYKTPNPFRP